MMKIKLPLDQTKKLTVIFRVEAGCLGPKGNKIVDEFSVYAQNKLEHVDADYIHWIIEARHDKSMAEMEYKINNKKLSHDKAEKYLNMFDKKLDIFERHLYDNLANFIDEYMHH